jgi:hypothetical protein
MEMQGAVTIFAVNLKRIIKLIGYDYTVIAIFISLKRQSENLK